MAMNPRPRGGVASEINVTPMIDVLLVLLVIFMVAQQGLVRGLAVQVPPPDDETITSAVPEVFVLEVAAGGRYRLNSRPVEAGALESTLAGIFAERPRKVLFVKGGEALRYADVVAAVDASRAAGVEVVALVPRVGGAAL